MPDLDEQIRYPVLDHLRVAEKLLRLIEQLSQKPNSCDHTLVHSYSLQSMGHLQAAQRLLTPETQQQR